MIFDQHIWQTAKCHYKIDQKMTIKRMIKSFFIHLKLIYCMVFKTLKY